MGRFNYTSLELGDTVEWEMIEGLVELKVVNAWYAGSRAFITFTVIRHPYQKPGVDICCEADEFQCQYRPEVIWSDEYVANWDFANGDPPIPDGYSEAISMGGGIHPDFDPDFEADSELVSLYVIPVGINSFGIEPERKLGLKGNIVYTDPR